MFEFIRPDNSDVPNNIQLKDWSITQTNKNISETVILLADKMLFYNGKKITLFMWHKLPKRNKIIISIMDNGNNNNINNTTCVMLKININKRTGNMLMFTPHAGKCNTLFSPKELMEIVDFVCNGLLLNKLTLQDAAIVKICKNDNRTIKIGDMHKNNVPLSALLLVTTGKSYYEKYNFVPVTHKKNKYTYEKQLNKSIKLPVFIISFLKLKTKYSKLGIVLKKIIIEYSNVCKFGNIPKKIHNWIIKKLKTLDIPTKYNKFYINDS